MAWVVVVIAAGHVGVGEGHARFPRRAARGREFGRRTPRRPTGRRGRKETFSCALGCLVHLKAGVIRHGTGGPTVRLRISTDGRVLIRGSWFGTKKGFSGAGKAFFVKLLAFLSAHSQNRPVQKWVILLFLLIGKHARSLPPCAGARWSRLRPFARPNCRPRPRLATEKMVYRTATAPGCCPAFVC